jgi:hypothetical protein
LDPWVCDRGGGGAPLRFYSRWQPLLDEDRHTALVFGFFRHAPASFALDPWLSEVIGRSVRSCPLEPQCFWPTLLSVVEGSIETEPELVFDVDDDVGRLRVVVEVKPGYGMHTIEQVTREVIDVAAPGRAPRIVLVMIGADLGPPREMIDWPERVAAAVTTRGFEASTETRYSSFAQIGTAIDRCGAEHPEWARYATDVTAQLKRKGLLGYGGAPMLDDLDRLTLRNSVEAFNRIIRAARQFFLQLHEHPAFLATGLQPDTGADENGYLSARMQRDGRADALTKAEDMFQTQIFVSLYRHPELAGDDRVFVAFDLVNDPNQIRLIAGHWRGYKPGEASLRRLVAALAQPDASTIKTRLPATRASDAGMAWTYTGRPWQPNHASSDIEWVTERSAATLSATAAVAPPAA